MNEKRKVMLTLIVSLLLLSIVVSACGSQDRSSDS